MLIYYAHPLAGSMWMLGLLRTTFWVCENEESPEPRFVREVEGSPEPIFDELCV